MQRPWLDNYQEGVSAAIDLNQHQSIADLFDKTIEKYQNDPAFYNMGRTLTFDELEDLSARLASYFQFQLGLKKGGRVALMMPNILQYPIALFAVLRAGLVVVNINPQYTKRELQHQLRDSGAETIVIFSNSAAILQSVLPQTQIKNVIVTGIGDLLRFPRSLLVNFVVKHVKKMVPAWHIDNAIRFNHILEQQGSAFQRPALDHHDIAFLQYTGGTTGIAKGAILSHGNMVANVLQTGNWVAPIVKEQGEVIITALPLYHIFSLLANSLLFFSLGALNVLITNPRDIPGFIREIKKFRFSAITGVNTLFNALNQNKDFKGVDFSQLHCSLGGGMAVQAAVAKTWQDITGKTLVEAYGLTETSPAALMNPMNLRDHNGFIGLPIPQTDVIVIDDQGKPQPYGEIGEICIRGPQVTQGYWNQPEETENVMTDDGFLKTGDLGFMTEQGFVKLVDRKKDMIIVSGFKVFPNEIEDVVVEHPHVFECAAIGIPDEKSGEVVKLFVVLSGQDLSEDDVLEYCRLKLTAYKIPKQVEFRDALPKSNVGKVLRRQLR